MKGSEHSLEDSKDEVRKLFMKLEQRVFLENSDFKKDVASCFKELKSDIGDINLALAATRSDNEQFKKGIETVFKDMFDKFLKLEGEVGLTKQKQSLVDRKLSEFMEKTERIIDENIHLSGMCGDFARYKDLRSLLEHLLVSYQNFGISKDKTLFELQNLKEKIDSKVSSIGLKLENQEKSIRLFYNSKIDAVELSLKSTLNENLEKLNSLRGEYYDNFKMITTSFENNNSEHVHLNLQINSLNKMLNDALQAIDQSKFLSLSELTSLRENHMSEIVDIRNEIKIHSKNTKDLQNNIDILVQSLNKSKASSAEKPGLNSTSGNILRETDDLEKVNSTKPSNLKSNLKSNDVSNKGPILPPILSPSGNQSKNKIIFQSNNKKQMRNKPNENLEGLRMNDEMIDADKYFTIDDNVEIDPDYWTISGNFQSPLKNDKFDEHQDLQQRSMNERRSNQKRKLYQSSNQLKLVIQSNYDINTNSGSKSARAMSSVGNNSSTQPLSNNMEKNKMNKSIGKDKNSFNNKSAYKLGIKALEKDEEFIRDNCKVRIFDPPNLN